MIGITEEEVINKHLLTKLAYNKDLLSHLNLPFETK
jgi:hypothetical protein